MRNKKSTNPIVFQSLEGRKGAGDYRAIQDPNFLLMWYKTAIFYCSSISFDNLFNSVKALLYIELAVLEAPNIDRS